MLLAACLGSAHPTGGAAFLLQSYAASFLARRGPGDGLTILGVSNDIQDVTTGAIILAAALVRRISLIGTPA